MPSGRPGVASPARVHGLDRGSHRDELRQLEDVNKGLETALAAHRAAHSKNNTSRKADSRSGAAATASTGGKGAGKQSVEPLDLIQRLQRQGDTYTRKIETEKRLIANLQSNLTVLQTKVEQQRQQMGGIGGAERKQKEVMRRLQQMENRLDNALIKYNRRVAENRDLRSEIDSCRRQRLVYDNIYTGLEQELAEKKKTMARVISRTASAVQKQDRLREQLVHLRGQIEQEQDEFDQKWSTLGAEIAMGRQAHSIQLKKELKEQGEGDGEGANGEDDGSAGKDDGDEQSSIERKTKRKLARGAWAIAKEKAQIHMSAEKIQAYEVAFEKIREITGISDIEVLVDRFIEAEERNFSTFKYISHLNKELEKLDMQIHEARSEIERFRGQGVETDSQRKKILRELESKLHRTETRTREFDDRHLRVASLLSTVKKRVQEIFHRIGCKNTVAASFVGNQGVTDGNLMQHLGIIEQRTNEVLQMYAASGAAFKDGSAPAAGAEDAHPANSSGPGSPSPAHRRRLSLGVGPRQASGSHVVSVEPPGMEEPEPAAAFMMDEADRPMTRVELMRMIKADPDGAGLADSAMDAGDSALSVAQPPAKSVSGVPGRRRRRGSVST